MHRKEWQIYEKAKAFAHLQDRSREEEVLGNARLHRLHRLEQGRACALSKPKALDHGYFNSSAAGLAGANQDRRQQARRAVSVANQDVAGGEGGVATIILAHLEDQSANLSQISDLLPHKQF